MPTVEQVWRALPQKTDVVAGEPGIYNEVSWVVTLRPTPPAFDRLRGKELAFVDSAMVNGLGVTLAYLVTSLAEQGASALVILGEVLPAAREIANKYKIPLLKLPPTSDLDALEKQISLLIREEREHHYQQEQELTKKLMELTLAGLGTDAILDKLEETTGRTVILLDPDFTPRFPAILSKIPDIQQILTRLFQPPPTLITGAKLTSAYSGFLSPVTGKQGIEGYLLVIAPAAEIKEADRMIAKVGALSLAIEISRQQAVEDIEDKFQVEMVESLLNGDLPAAAVNKRAERLGLDLSQSYAVIALQFPASSFNEATIARKAVSILKNALCHYRGNSLIILYPVAAGITPLDLRYLSRQVSQQLTAHLGVKVSLGMGRAYTGAAGLRASFQEAERSLAVGKKLFGEGSSSFFGDLGIYRLLLSVGADELKSYYKDALGQLIDYEQQRDGELLNTLEAVLQYPTLADTAKALHVHRNTLLYRIQRIQEITNADLDDGETRLMLHLALKAADIIRVS